MSQNKTYFEGLNGLRFLAAIFVFFHHVEQHKFWIDYPNLWGVHIIDNIGHQARVIFFVLSGFLITYLFLNEFTKTANIDWKKFQIRRALRLWPVYYLMTAVAIFVLPQFIDIADFNEKLSGNFTKEVVIYALMLPNLARLLPPIVGANQFWSVGVQEQFYFLWPILMKLFIKRFVPFILTLIAFKLIVEILLLMAMPIVTGTSLFIPVKQALQMWQLLLFEQMAIGALGAYIVFTDNKKILSLVFNRTTGIITLLVFIALLFVITEFPGYPSIQGLIALILIMNISLNKSFFLKLENPVLNYLGNISFGMYAYHTACIAIVITLLQKTGLTENAFLFNLLLYAGSVVLTIAISALSYRYFEGYFLNLKSKFKVIKGKEEPRKEPATTIKSTDEVVS